MSIDPDSVIHESVPLHIIGGMDASEVFHVSWVYGFESITPVSQLLREEAAYNRAIFSRLMMQDDPGVQGFSAPVPSVHQFRKMTYDDVILHSIAYEIVENIFAGDDSSVSQAGEKGSSKFSDACMLVRPGWKVDSKAYLESMRRGVNACAPETTIAQKRFLMQFDGEEKRGNGITDRASVIRHKLMFLQHTQDTCMRRIAEFLQLEKDKQSSSGSAMGKASSGGILFLEWALPDIRVCSLQNLCSWAVRLVAWIDEQ